MELALIFGLIGILLGAVGGWVVRGHVHEIADKASSGIGRALTISSGTVAAIDSVSPATADALQRATAEIKDHVTDAVAGAAAGKA